MCETRSRLVKKLMPDPTFGMSRNEMPLLPRIVASSKDARYLMEAAGKLSLSSTASSIPAE